MKFKGGQAWLYIRYIRHLVGTVGTLWVHSIFTLTVDFTGRVQGGFLICIVWVQIILYKIQGGLNVVRKKVSTWWLHLFWLTMLDTVWVHR